METRLQSFKNLVYALLPFFKILLYLNHPEITAFGHSNVVSFYHISLKYSLFNGIFTRFIDWSSIMWYIYNGSHFNYVKITVLFIFIVLVIVKHFIFMYRFDKFSFFKNKLTLASCHSFAVCAFDKLMIVKNYNNIKILTNNTCFYYLFLKRFYTLCDFERFIIVNFLQSLLSQKRKSN